MVKHASAASEGGAARWRRLSEKARRDFSEALAPSATCSVTSQKAWETSEPSDKARPFTTSPGLAAECWVGA
eukprot:2794024-Pyramimonas_sp.AAC.1